MRGQGSKHSKWKIALASAFIGVILSGMTYRFVDDVQEQLWEQSIYTILESTQQGCNTLRVQLEEEYRSLGNIAGYLKMTGQTEALDVLLKNYVRMDQDISLYREGGNCLPSGTQADQTVAEALAGNEKDYGVLDPHISSVTGVNVFDIFVRLTMADGSAGYLVKEYEVGSIVDTFSISFYQDAGFSYVDDFIHYILHIHYHIRVIKIK